MVLPMSSPRRVGAFCRDLLDQKSKSPLFPGGGGMITIDLCIISTTVQDIKG